MALRSWLHSLRTWMDRHPWLTTFAFAIVGTVAIWLLPPRPELGDTIVRVCLTFAAILVLHRLIYRRFFPSQQQVEEERRRADEIAASVRNLRERDSRL
jgi:hypothetical protein